MLSLVMMGRLGVSSLPSLVLIHNGSIKIERDCGSMFSSCERPGAANSPETLGRLLDFLDDKHHHEYTEFDPDGGCSVWHIMYAVDCLMMTLLSAIDMYCGLLILFF